jgi:energy-coupling factor transporter ATP-binding protein EcfA2
MVLARHLTLFNTGRKKYITSVTVLSMNTSILVLDESSAGLDPRAQDVNQFAAQTVNHHT